MALPVSKFLVSTRNWGGFAINVGLGRELVLVNCDIKVLVPNWYWWFVIGCDFLSTGLGQYSGNWSSGCIFISSKSYHQSEEVLIVCDVIGPQPGWATSLIGQSGLCKPAASQPLQLSTHLTDWDERGGLQGKASRPLHIITFYNLQFYKLRERSSSISFCQTICQNRKVQGFILWWKTVPTDMMIQVPISYW